MVGAPGGGGATDNAGAIHIFELNTGNDTWSEFDKLTAVTATEDGFFGRAVAIDGDVIAVSALLDEDEEAEDGIVFVYRYDSGTPEWALEDVLLPPSGAMNFGRSIAVDGDFIAVGYDLEGLGLAGGVAVFKQAHGVWTSHTDALVYDSLGDPEDSGFGVSVAMEDEVIVVGACGDSEDGDGRVHVFQLRDGYFERAAILEVPGIDYDDGFGLRVDIAGHLVIVGAPYQESNDSGAAYVFTGDDCFNVWQVVELTAPTPTAYRAFGSEVAISSERAMILEPTLGYYGAVYESVIDSPGGCE